MNVGRKNRQTGFTIVELLIAMSVFSVIVIVITVAVMQFTRQYYKGVASSSTQAVARSIIDDLTRSIQFNANGIYGIHATSGGGGPITGYCIGGTKRYSFAMYQQVVDKMPFATNQGYHGLVSDTVTGCNSSSISLPGLKTLNPLPPNTNARELLDSNMRLAKLTITSNGVGDEALYMIDVKVVYGDNDLLMHPDGSTSNLDNPDIICKSSVGSQFCAVSELTTTVKRRVK